MPILLSLTAAESSNSGATDRLTVAIETLRRLKGTDLDSNPRLRAVVLQVLKKTEGTPQFVELVRDFNLNDQGGALLAYAVDHANESSGVEALRLVVAQGGIDLVRATVSSNPSPKFLELLANAPEKELVPALEGLVVAPQHDTTLRERAVHALAQSAEGATSLLNLADRGQLPESLRRLTAAELRDVRWPEIRAKAAGLVPPGERENGPLLLPVSELARLRGDTTRGMEVFGRETVGCARCHQISGRGTDFGPNLSEIGTKLAKEALYEAILDPSAGISFGFEPWVIELKTGDEAYGLLSSETGEEIAIKASSGIVARYRKTEVARKTQQKSSIMPSGLVQTMSQQDLIDLVEYLASLKKQEHLGQSQ